MKSISYYLYLLAILPLLLVACQQENDLGENSVSADKVQLKFTPMGLGQHIVTTRGTTKDPAETEVHNLHVFFFNHDSGEYLTPVTSGSTQEGKFYRYLEGGGTTLLIDGEQFEDPSSVDIYVLANLADGTLIENTDGFPQTAGGEVIADRTALQNYIYQPYNDQNFTTRMPESGLPMVGYVIGQNLTQTGGYVIDVEMKSLMARIEFSITMNPIHISGDYPVLQINRLDMVNMPGGARVQEYNSANQEESVTKGDCSSLYDESSATLRNGESVSFSFYMFEHLRNTNGSSIDSSVSEEYKQRYKPNLAKEDAAYVLLTGRYFDNGGHTYNVTYKLYLGANHTDDFNITRNCKYVNNISVKGITAIDHPDDGQEVVGLDARVTVSRETNDFYITILREREHDAHFNITPMDVYIPNDGTVTVEIPDADTPENSWIRLEAVDENITPAEGYGKRDYFTTDLLTVDLNNTENKIVELPGHTNTALTVRRVYLYIDEFISTLPSRSVELQIYYTPKDGDKKLAQTLLIEQKGLVKIEYLGLTYYIERYEEYRSYFDPLSKFDTDQRYDVGLPWGGESSGRYGGTSNSSPVNTYDQSPELTRQILVAYNDDGDMTLNDVPSSAAEYCYNKNKRNRDDHSVSTIRWCLPSVRELEGALVTQYYQFPEFQGAYYWSCNVPRANGGNRLGTDDSYDGQSTERARASMIIYDPNNDEQYKTVEYGTVSGYPNYKYVNSNWDDWDPAWLTTDYRRSLGNQLRTNLNRIRAIYIPAEGESVPEN